jgi:hypothetical protein
MPVNTELYDLVKEAKKTLREENKPVNAKAVIKHVSAELKMSFSFTTNWKNKSRRNAMLKKKGC